ncbi:MAG: class I SAM-dependent RNA methyltransferase [Firmicutes bacterium]|nr:class I SAM-dependent RNA methyltransferase [Bacillota bacterium]
MPQETAPESGKRRSKVVFIRGAIPDEKVQVSLYEEKKDYYLADVIAVIDPSPDRIEPNPRCIGCQLDYIAYERQVAIKEEVLLDSLRRVGGIETKLSDPIILKNNIWNYRYRAQLKLGDGKIGFYKERTNEIADTDYSPLLINELNDVLRKVHKAVHGNPDKFQTIAELHLSYGNGSFALLKVKPKTKAHEGFWNELAVMLLDTGLEGVIIETQGTAPAGRLKYGRDSLVLYLDEITYTISPASFFQANWRLNQIMVSFVKETLRPLQGKRVLDLYSGAGNFALPLATEAKEVIAIENQKSAVEDGERNLRLNHIRNVRFFNMPVENYNMSNYGPFDIVILDPPRSGLADKVTGGLLKAKPEQIVYVSCNPSTLARDLKKLSAGYYIDSIMLVDLFPQTYHIETLTFLKRIKG